MSWMRHHAVLVTSNDESVERARRDAVQLARTHCFPVDAVSPLSPPVVNGYRSFAVFPDGSKEGWDDSDAGDAFRVALADRLNRYRYEDGSSGLKWCVVQYGDENDQNRMVASEADARASESPLS